MRKLSHFIKCTSFFDSFFQHFRGVYIGVSVFSISFVLLEAGSLRGAGTGWDAIFIVLHIIYTKRQIYFGALRLINLSILIIIFRTISISSVESNDINLT